MPDTRSHRGPHSDDAQLFSDAQLPKLQDAVAELSWLLSRKYAPKSSLELVGNRHQLTARQRQAVERCACSAFDVVRRGERSVEAPALAGMPLWLDGYNVLTTVEVALGGAVVLEAMDGTYRDIASLHGTYRTVEETVPALDWLGAGFQDLECAEWHWLLDKPVSNSARLKQLIDSHASARSWRWSVELVQNPDAVLRQCDHIIATADSVILDRCSRWFNLVPHVVRAIRPPIRVIRLNRPDNG